MCFIYIYIKEWNFLSFYARIKKNSFGILERFPTKCTKYFSIFFFFFY